MKTLSIERRLILNMIINKSIKQLKTKKKEKKNTYYAKSYFKLAVKIKLAD